jgi:hypothetical protein
MRRITRGVSFDHLIGAGEKRVDHSNDGKVIAFSVFLAADEWR